MRRIAFVVCTACAGSGRPPSDLEARDAIRADVEASKARLAITVDPVVTIDDVRVDERRAPIEDGFLGLYGYPVRATITFRADDTPGRVVETRTRQLGFLVFRDAELDELPARVREGLAADHYPRHRGGWDAWRCTFDRPTGCRIDLVP